VDHVKEYVLGGDCDNDAEGVTVLDCGGEGVGAPGEAVLGVDGVPEGDAAAGVPVGASMDGVLTGEGLRAALGEAAALELPQPDAAADGEALFAAGVAEGKGTVPDGDALAPIVLAPESVAVEDPVGPTMEPEGDAVATRLGTGRVGAVEAEVDGEGSEEGDKGEADGVLLAGKDGEGCDVAEGQEAAPLGVPPPVAL